MKTILIICALFFISTSNAYAYIDPGIGSIILQGIIGAIAAISLFFSRIREFFVKILGLNSKNKHKKALKK